MANSLREIGWRKRNDPGKFDRMPVKPNELVDKEEVLELDKNEEYFEDRKSWLASNLLDDPDLDEEEFWHQIHSRAPEMVPCLMREYEPDLHNLLERRGQRVFDSSVPAETGPFDLKEKLHPQLQVYEAEKEDVIKTIQNADQRACSYMADCMSLTWMLALDQEFIRSGWVYEDMQILPFYSSRDDGFVDFRQYMI